MAENEWSGIMGYSRDGRPWVGEVPGRKGVFLSGGYTGHGSFLFFHIHKSLLIWLPRNNLLVTLTGMPNAALCARYVAQLVLMAHEHNGDNETWNRPVEQQPVIPAGYIISEARIRRVRERAWIAEIFEPGILGALED